MLLPHHDSGTRTFQQSAAGVSPISQLSYGAAIKAMDEEGARDRHGHELDAGLGGVGP